jgi:magnesium chelatase family protein
MRLAQTYHRALGSLPGGFATLDIFSVAGLELPPLVRPFRAPYHKISEAGMIGGGTWPCPGEVSLAHCGTLLLDEIPEFRRTVLDALASSLQAGVVGHHRKGVMHTFPAVPAIVVGTANPCPCGFAGSTCECKCSSSSRARHEARLSEIQEKLGMTRVDVRR